MRTQACASPVGAGQLPTLQDFREDEGEQEEEEEGELPCHHCGAIESFQYLYLPDTGTFSGTCIQCGGASRNSFQERQETLYITVESSATNWRSEQLLATEQSRDLIEAFPYSEKFLPIDNDTDTRETDWPDHYLVQAWPKP